MPKVTDNVDKVKLIILLAILVEKCRECYTTLDVTSDYKIFLLLLTLWLKFVFCPSLRPLTQKVVALAAEVKNSEKDKDHLTINLRRAEEEVCDLVL